MADVASFHDGLVVVGVDRLGNSGNSVMVR